MYVFNVRGRYSLADGEFRLFPSEGFFYAAGAEALNSYGGDVPNSKLLLDYGFALERNVAERVRLCLALDSEDARHSPRQFLFRVFAVFRAFGDTRGGSRSSRLF